MEKADFMRIIKLLHKLRTWEEEQFAKSYGGDIGYRTRWMFREGMEETKVTHRDGQIVVDFKRLERL